jgi:hypothetical protein
LRVIAVLVTTPLTVVLVAPGGWNKVNWPPTMILPSD